MSIARDLTKQDERKARNLLRQARRFSHLLKEAKATHPGIYEGSTFKLAGFIQWCRSQGIAWPVKESLANGRLYYRRDDDTFKDMSIRHPLIAHVIVYVDYANRICSETVYYMIGILGILIT